MDVEDLVEDLFFCSLVQLLEDVGDTHASHVLKQQVLVAEWIPVGYVAADEFGNRNPCVLPDPSHGGRLVGSLERMKQVSGDPEYQRDKWLGQSAVAGMAGVDLERPALVIRRWSFLLQFPERR